jgi:hypothetical protein
MAGTGDTDCVYLNYFTTKKETRRAGRSKRISLFYRSAGKRPRRTLGVDQGRVFWPTHPGAVLQRRELILPQDFNHGQFGSEQEFLAMLYGR